MVGPKSLKDASVVAEREKRIDEPHVKPLNDWVRTLRTDLPEAIVPWFDPADGGVKASVLWLLEAPGPKATRDRGGSGFISSDNNDQTAANLFEAMASSGVDRGDVVLWNVVPYYIGSTTKIRPFNDRDLDENSHLLADLIDLLPNLAVVILGGGAAQKMWRKHAPAEADHLVVVECPHPSPTNVNTRPGTMDEVVEAWRTAADTVTPAGDLMGPALFAPLNDRELAEIAASDASEMTETSLLRIVDRVVTRRWDAALRRAAGVEGLAVDKRVNRVTRSFATELGLMGAVSGGVAAAPGVGTAAVIAMSGGEFSANLIRTSDLILTLGAVHGLTDASVEERRAWVLAVLALGDGASTGFTKISGEVGKGLGKKATAKIPNEALRKINAALGRTIVTKYGTKRGAIAIGRVLPFGIGMVIGGSANIVITRTVARHASKFFANLPDGLR